MKKGPIQLGEYVLATKYSDRDPHDPWRVGFVCQIVRTWKPGRAPETSYVIGEEDGTWEQSRRFPNAKRITAEQGREWIEAWGGIT